MTQISAGDNNFVFRTIGSGAFLPAAREATATSRRIIQSLAAIPEKGTFVIRLGLLGILSIVTTGATMWLVGITMNDAFN
jgi:hypothetical protein